MIFQGMGPDFQMLSVANTPTIWSIMQAKNIKHFLEELWAVNSWDE